MSGLYVIFGESEWDRFIGPFHLISARPIEGWENLGEVK